MLVENKRTSINRLRVRTQVRDSLRVRLDYDRFLSSADVHPTNLPANAIVCINRFSAAPPQQSSHSMNSSWEQEVRHSLGDIVNRAARPILGKAPGAANAVIFADMAELLACLARDWAGGNLLTNWWWKVLLREDRSLWALWKRHPEFIPAALQHLVRQKVAAEVLNGLTTDEVQDLGQKVIESFAVYSLSGLFKVRLKETSPREVAELGQSPKVKRKPFAPFVERTRTSRAPWRSFLAEINFNELGPEQERFLAVCLMLQREPSLVRSQRFGHAVSVWQQELTRSIQGAAQNRSSEMREPRSRGNAATAKPAKGPVTDSINDDFTAASLDPVRLCDPESVDGIHSQKPRTPLDSERESNSQSSSLPGPADLVADNRDFVQPPRTSKSLAPEHPTSSIEGVPETLDMVPSLRSESATESTVPAALADDVVPISTNDSLCEPETEITQTVSEDLEVEPALVVDTKLGGFFYLVNLGIYLDLYCDFTTPNSTGIPLNIWDFVTVVGAELIGQQFQNDPIWSLLETLAGRDQTIPAGGDFIFQNDWRMTPEWLAPFEKDAQWRWTAGSNRLQVIHPAKFLVLDIKRDFRNASEQLGSEADVYREFYSKLEFSDPGVTSSARCTLEVSETLRVWLSRLLPYLRARLSRSFGVDSNNEPGRLLCQRPARVTVTATHVDVYFGLADLPIEIRLAGLDRDPGWVPAAGRFITFHYE